MLNYYRPAFVKLAALVNRLDPWSPEAASTCYEIQCEMISRIRRVEKRIRYWKSANPQTMEAQESVRGYQRIARTLRYFGDAIAFTYIDRCDIRPISVGKEAGFITGKKGFRLERKLLKFVSENGGSALLADLTNWLRHGDFFCFSPDRMPMIMEVKMSRASKDARLRRQKRRLKQLTNYLETDKAVVRGIPMYRYSPPSELVHYADVMAGVAEQAYEDGSAYRRIGDSLCYFAIRESTPGIYAEVTKSFEAPIPSLVTADQYYALNYPYYPITLVIKNPDALAEYLTASMVLGVVVDFARLHDSIKSHGGRIRRLNTDRNEPWFIELEIEGFPVRISRAMFGKLFMEFIDIDWFAESLMAIRDTPQVQEFLIDTAKQSL